MKLQETCSNTMKEKQAAYYSNILSSLTCTLRRSSEPAYGNTEVSLVKIKNSNKKI